MPALDAWLDQFDLDWRPGGFAAAAGRVPSGADPRTALFELLKIDLERRWQTGDRPQVEEYLAAYPVLGSVGDVPVDVIRAEVDARERYGHPVTLEELRLRFPGRTAALAPASPATESLFPPETRPPLEPGARVGRYQVLGRLGGGSMGVVYLARDTALNRTVALKVPRFELGRRRVVRARFLQEATAAANLRHPNLAQVYDIGCEDGMDFLTMAFIDGEPMAARIAGGPVPSDRAVGWVAKLADGLAEAHRLGVVHRDLKPSNVIVTPAGEPVVIDYGLALSDTPGDIRLTGDGSVLGTPAYMAPEQVRGVLADIGPRSDVYSLGVILYELLTGAVPFTGSMQAVFDQVVAAHPVRPSCRNPSVPAWLDAVCLRAMAKAPADRFPSMAAFAAALRGRDAGRVGRRRWLRAVLVGAGSVAVGGGGVAAWLLRAPGTDADPMPPDTGGTPTPPSPRWRAAETIPVGGRVTALAASPTDPALVAWGADPSQYGVVARGGREPVRVTPSGANRGPVTAVHFAPREPRLVAEYDEAPTVRTVPALTDDPLAKRVLIQPWRRLVACRWSPAGTFLVLLHAGDRKVGPATIARIDSAPVAGRGLEIVGELSGDATAAAFTSDGRTLAIASATRIDFRDGTSLEPAGGFALREPVTAVAFLSDGRTMAVRAGSQVEVRDATGQLVRTLTATATATALAVSPDGRTIAWADGNAVGVGDAEGTAAHRLDGHTGAVAAVAFASDGRALYSAGADGTIRVWEAS